MLKYCRNLNVVFNFNKVNECVELYFTYMARYLVKQPAIVPASEVYTLNLELSFMWKTRH